MADLDHHRHEMQVS
jgi:hypothetical protein